MSRILQKLDPRRSLATAVAWLAVVLAMGVTLVTVTIGDHTRQRLLAERDALMMRYVTAVAGDLERKLDAGGAAAAIAHFPAIAQQARERVHPDERARVLLLSEQHQILAASPPMEPGMEAPVDIPGTSMQPVPGGKRHVVMTAPHQATPGLRSLGLQVAVMQGSEEAGQGGTVRYWQAAMALLVSIAVALVGIAFARRLTRRLARLATAVQRVTADLSQPLPQPRGHDEVALLGHSFVRLIETLRSEREELDRLMRELEQRVAARTREVERLAADSRYAAVVRERLRLARDMHDTLAHSMMEMLAEVRTLRLLHAHDPAKLAAEIERAEQVAQHGLREARQAVSQMRLNSVRDLGLGAALQGAVDRFAERTGLEVRYSADPVAASFADARAEGVFRIAEEAFRNIDRHAKASHVEVMLRDVGDTQIELVVSDDGIGFDPQAGHPGHYGLVGIREQAQLIDAELELHSQPGRGSTLRLKLALGPEMRAAIAEDADEITPPA